MLELSERLQTIVNHIHTPTEGVIADIGCDHGYISIYLAQNRLAHKIYAMDINPGPLEKAKKNSVAYQVSDQVECILSNGLDKLHPSVDTVIVAGMGGDLIAEILEKGQQKMPQLRQLLLSPHSEVSKVRRKIHQLEFQIDKEAMVKDAGHYYTIISALPGEQEEYSEIEYLYGRHLIQQRDPLLYEQLVHRSKHLKSLYIRLLKRPNPSELIQERMKEIASEEEKIKEVLTWFEQ